ncbi:hypothetical protein E1293_13750 [Actinomadura darangshiensis]|uniref:Uncharacterized protein n=1 Tax=Actinomadura darangshiensis TaxID=705336 RepID=A0A4R5BG70_9ACTN|nr:hypothetical protein [Actinomadura darangshiensis]TDD83906.1 hypothetical protein E1293_13750 [Actinomadura darangshiensis]
MAVPYLTWLVIAALLAVLASMAFMAEQRSQLIASLVSRAVVAVAYPLRRRFGRTPPRGRTPDTDVQSQNLVTVGGRPPEPP